MCVCVRARAWWGVQNGLIRAEGSQPVAPIIFCIALVGNVFPVEEPVTQYSSPGSSVAAPALSEAPQHKRWHPQSESRDRQAQLIHIE